ncbi:hypothetical protein EJP617_29150 [Erwinia sp. Ejp617]|nr:hypothetical protein [Erwinia sp. Ejp617]ADP12596.1 hypothetical protein EJP617_29150 [Erwinia sp. Ejp617]
MAGLSVGAMSRLHCLVAINYHTDAVNWAYALDVPGLFTIANSTEYSANEEI